MDRHTRRYLAAAVREQETVATFGEARLIRHLDGRLEIVSGTEDDRREAQEWVSRFIQRAECRTRQGETGIPNRSGGQP